MKKLRLTKYWSGLLMLISFNLLSLSLFAQTTTITGTVVDEKGMAVIGATVKIKSHPGATGTDVNGKFSIEAPQNATTLVVSYLGYITQEVTLKANSNNLKITLAPSPNNLNEVVVVGY